MEAASAAPAAPALEPSTSMVEYYYLKRNDSMSMDARSLALGRQPLETAHLSHAIPCNNEQFPEGAYYEIDHSKLPPKSPIQLKAIRVVKVSETTRLDVTVSFPSALALRSCFGPDPASDGSPELDEQFVMSTNHAGRILHRLIPPPQLEAEKHLASFWLLASKLYENPLASPPIMKPENEEEEEMKMPSAVGACLLALKCPGIVAWGVRRRVKYIGRHQELKEEEAVEEKLRHGLEIGKKRLRQEAERKEKKRKKKESHERERKRPRVEEDKAKREHGGERDKRVKGSKDRWSADRYEAAELKLLDIMREKGAVLGNPILRAELREDARRHIGDTGLLDHLLKHMAGKVVREGAERFRRRHNAEGAMEYWLEPADFVDIRRQAGVMDPYWIPPPGWKLGDATSPCHYGSECKQEIAQLKDLVAILKREMEQLSSQKQLEKEAKDAQSEADKGRGDRQESYQPLLERNTKLEEDMAWMFSSLQALKEEIRLLKVGKDKEEEESKVVDVVMEDKGKAEGVEAKEVEGKEKKGVWEKISDSENNTSNSNMSNRTNDAAVTAAALTNNSSSNESGEVKPAARRSGFRICKPQGTFLWPDMGASSGITINASNRPASASMTRPRGLVVPTEDRLQMLFGGGGCGIQTPPSASSATSAPRLLLLPGPETSSAAAPHPASENALVPHAAAQRLHLGEERTAGSGNICASPYCHMARAPTSSPSLPRGALGEGRKGKEAAAACGLWGPEEAAYSGITTDLALATPSNYL